MNPTQEIVDKLDTLIRLVAIGLCGEKPQLEKIRILASAGLAPRDIADVIGTTPNTVSVALSSLRKANKTKRKRATTTSSE